MTAISPKTSIQNTIAVFSSLECPQLNVGYSLKGYAEEPYSSCSPSQRAEFGFTPQGKEQAERDNPGHKRLQPEDPDQAFHLEIALPTAS